MIKLLPSGTPTKEGEYKMKFKLESVHIYSQIKMGTKIDGF